MQITHRPTPILGLTTLLLIGLGLAARPAAAQVTYLPNNTIINSAYPNDTYVGESTTNTLSSPTVDLVTGGSVDGDLQAYNASIVNVTGGTIFNDLDGFGSSTLNVSGGSIHQNLLAEGASTANISGGSFGRYLYALNVSTVNISGGTFGQYLGINFLDATGRGFNFFGTGFSFAPGPTVSTPIAGMDYTLTGTLLNGQSITNDVIEVTPGAAMFTFNAASVPEASTASMLVVERSAWHA